MTQQSAKAAPGDIRLYIYDTTSGWCAHAYAASDAFHVAAGKAPDSADAAWSLVATVQALQARGQLATSQSMRALPPDAIDQCMRYLGSTRTFEHVCRAYGVPTGHWLVVLYRFDDRHPILRPAFLVHPADVLSLREVTGWVGQTVEHDRNTSASEVHRLVFKGAGPKLSMFLR